MKSNPLFKTFIEEKPLYYKEIDHERVHQAYAVLKPYIAQPLVIHIVGTNGKGSTGRIMATLLDCMGKRVGHFSSPHIIKFNERIWIEGKDVSDEVLEIAHQKLYAILGQVMSEALSYFEYTTLLALVVMEKLEVIVLEAGLGGEFDATNVVSKALSVITPIGIDHQDFLGSTIEAIATTKINSIEKKVIVALQSSETVYKVAKRIVLEKDATLYRVDELKKIYGVEAEAILKTTKTLGWTRYLYENTLLALYALKTLSLAYKIEDLKRVTLFGRFYPLLPNVRIDVGHNLLASEAMVQSLEEKYKQKRIVLVYNALNDKDYGNILKVFKKYIKRVELITLQTQRAVDMEQLELKLKTLEIPYTFFESLNDKEEYLVFGSFYVVEAFLYKINFDFKK
ncbi:MAG: folylpolyglutamate synthase [Sulfurovum sp. FS06-10]|nr:MAG: folylpolyglutamate synthase [Sulfurovum sp. FS06-10]